MIFCEENRVVIWRDRKKKYKKVITRIKWKRSYKSWLDRAVFLKFDFQVLINNDGLVYCMDCSLQHKFWYCIFTKQWQSHIATLLFFKLNPLLLLLLMKWFLHRKKKKTNNPSKQLFSWQEFSLIFDMFSWLVDQHGTSHFSNSYLKYVLRDLPINAL